MIISGCLTSFRISEFKTTIGGCLTGFLISEKSTLSGCLNAFQISENQIVSGCLTGIKVREWRQTEKNQYQFSDKTTINKKAFSLVVFINGEELDPCLLRDKIRLNFAVNQAKTAELTIAAHCNKNANQQGFIIDFYKYAGKPIEIYYQSETDYKLIYSGLVQTKKFNKTDKTFSIICSDEKVNKIDNLTENQLNNIGFFCEELFTEELTKEQIFSKRIESIPADYFYDNYGNFRLTELQPKQYGNDTIRCSILANTLNFGVLNLGEIVNNIKIKFNFNYYRKIQRNTKIYYNSGYGSHGGDSGVGFSHGFNEFLNFVKIHHFFPCPPINSVVSAFNGLDGVLGNFTYSGLPNLAGTGLVSPMGLDYWCLSCGCDLARRWCQNVQENYNFSVKNENSIAFFNEKSEELSFNLKIDNENDRTDFINELNCFRLPENSTIASNGDYVVNNDNSGVFAKAVNYALNVAKTKLYYAHFQNDISFDSMFMPDLDLSKSLMIDDNSFTGNVKVCEFTHEFDLSKRFAKTSVKCKWFKGFSGDLDFNNISRQNIPFANSIKSVKFGNIINKQYTSKMKNNDNTINIKTCLTENVNTSWGGSSNVEDINEQYGFIMQETILDSVVAATVGNIQAVAFKVKTPEIEKESTDGVTVETAQSFNIFIPDNAIVARCGV